ncbi:Loganic acid O-methyltransferase [Sesamum alatum]|uniref:Loganic acid O-methyltransferase n=1 Tax=Sesamum alatum TaxID=300844 RepID=A0AAE1YHE8_9LAMI|nr:Loganic acid O-methyltransferase [Sesamum alatum]
MHIQAHTIAEIYKMAQLYGMRRRCQSRAFSVVRSMLSCSFGRVETHQVELRPRAWILHRPIIGLHTMIGGEGPLSYAHNSSYQRGIIDVAKPIIEDEITKKFDISQLSSNSVWIADFGCSTGHNSFLAMQIITKAIHHKFQLERLISQIPDFYVFFNDQVTNDFNTLFRSLPLERHYQAIGLPGNYHARLLPKASLHFAFSSWSLQWLSQVPKAAADSNSPAWNKGRVDYVGARQEVYDAYSSQYANDIQTFLEARAEELVSGGLMALLVPAVPTKHEDSNTSYKNPTDLPLIGSCLLDMAKKGRLSEAKIDSFNIPAYYTFPEELKAIIERNGSYSIERMEIFDNPGKYAMTNARVRASIYRAVFEELLTDNFGGEIIDELFDTYRQKLEASPALLPPENDK